MQVGSDKGKNKIYKKDGSPKLKGGEKIITKLYEKCTVFYRKKDSKLWNDIIQKGKGDIYLTNRRFIYIRPPLAWYKRDVHTGERLRGPILNIFDTIANYQDAKEMKSKNIFEFIEFEFKEEFKLEYSFFGGARIILNTKSGDYQISTKKYILNEIKKILGEENKIE